MPDDGDRRGPVVRNEVSGTASNIVQAHSIGSVTFAAAPAPSAVPRQVPAPPAGFVDRAVVLERLAQMSDQLGTGERPAVVAMRGLPGVGKTAVLRAAAARLRDRFPDGVLHAEFGPLRERGSAAVSDVAAGMLRALGTAEQWIPADFVGRTDLLRSMTADSRLLVVLDDVGHDAQVTALLPNSGRSMVLVAGNRTLEGLLVDGAVDIELRPLEAKHAVDLLARLCPDGRITAQPAEARTLVDLCDRLPLAVRVAGVRLATHPAWSVERLVAMLSDRAAVLDELVASGAARVRAVFDLAYEDMPELTARVYRMVGLLVGPHFSAEVVAAMVSSGSAARVLDELCQWSVLEELPGGVFQMHRLVRLHALGCAEAEDSPQQRVEVLGRALRWWLLGAVTADVAVTGWERLRVADPRSIVTESVVLPSPATALDWLEREHDNLTGLLRAAVDNGWYGEASQLFEAMFAYYDNRQPLAAWIEAGSMAVTAAQRSGNRVAEARARCQLAKALQKNEQFVDAHAQLDTARSLAADLDDRLFASTLDFTGNVFLNEDDCATALEYFQQALAINQRLGRRRGTALLWWLCGRALAGLARAEEALEALTTARSIMETADGASMVPRILLSIGSAFLDLSRPRDARQAADSALALARDTGLTAVEADALEVLARVAHDLGDLEAERDCLRQAETAYAKMASPRAARVHARLVNPDRPSA